MPYKSDAQRRFMHAQHPQIAKKWDAETRAQSKAKSIGAKAGVSKVYKTGSPVAHKNMTLDPTGYINREVNKGRKVQPSTRRSGMAKMSLKRAAQRRMAAQQRASVSRKG